MANTDSSSISFTAYYTGATWYQHGLSVAAFNTTQGNLFYYLGQPFEKASHLIAGFSVQTTLLQRHLMIDHVLKKAIEEQGVTQIVEIACGLSPRGVRFCQAYPHIEYIEADLPTMLAHKQRLLQSHGLLSARHRVVALNILAHDTPDALSTVFANALDPTRNTLVITEGLVNYFELATMRIFWRHLASALKAFPKAAYVTDLYPNFAWHPMNKWINAFVYGLSVATKSRVNLHFKSQADIETSFKSDGFSQTHIHIPEAYYDNLAIPTQRSPSLVRVVENWV